MFYSLLGRVVWHGLRFFLRRKYGRAYLPKPVLAGAFVAALAAVALILGRSRSES
jgi:hypothetical protein